MHESARLSASIELLTECESAWKNPKPMPADIVINRYFKSRRYIGSKDRGAIAAFTYQIIRNYALLEWHAMRHGQEGTRALAIAALLLMDKIKLSALQANFTGERFAPSHLSQKENTFAKALAGHDLQHADMPDHVRYNYPQWLETDLKSSLGSHWKEELYALAQEAPVDLRTNTLLTSRDALLEALRKEGYEAESTPLSPIGVRLRKRAPVFTSATFKDGWFEMQDEGSQLVSLMLDAKPGQKIIDFCAGAGGKTLAVAAQMKNKGRILAWDTSERRLKQMPERLRRAKVDTVQLHVIESEHDAFIKRHKDSADGVIIDAPCSGSGTWRRNPDLKWRFHTHDLQEIITLQQRILNSAARLVKAGGQMLYVTCSTLEKENEEQIDAFLSQHENFRVVTGDNLCSKVAHREKSPVGMIRLTPYRNGTDGFFASLLRRLT